jgi:hypothetical protein
MNRVLSFRWIAALAVIVSLAVPDRAGAQRATSGTITGVVVAENGSAISDATLVISRSDGTQPQTVTSGAGGSFRVASLTSGLYRITARRIGFREATLPFLRVVAGQAADVRVVLTTSPTQLSTVEVRVSPTSIDASTTELAQKITIADVALVPTGREATSLVDLVPGAKKGFVWGGAGDGANNYQIDGIGVNHPGTGGEFLSPSIDWIESLEVRGLGAGAEHGGFQGGIVNAVTRTGTNTWRAALRSNYTAPSLTASNIQPNEEGAEQAMRRELGADMSGPLIKDRLFYFIGGTLLDRNVQIPELLTPEVDDVRPFEQEYRDLRGIGKLTFRPGPLDRIDALIGHTDNQIENADLNGIDDVASSYRVRSPTTFYELGWKRAGITSTFDARVVGFDSKESRLGYEGDNVPGVQIFTVGRQPIFQNAIFNDRVKPSSLGAAVSWSRQDALGTGSNRVVVGAEIMRGSWQKDRTRNGGMTWLPYVNPATGTVDPARAETWVDGASEWGGDIHINADVEDAAFYVQDYISMTPRFTLTPGVRYGRWRGWMTPTADNGERFLAVQHQAFDPRIGMIWDISGTSDFVVKAHYGRYHQAMNALFFDRVEGADAYENERFYFQGPPITDSRRTFTPAERDANLDTFSGFSPTFVETIMNEAGRVENYRQPYVDQLVASVEKRFGPRWKLELSFANRVNKDIVGLVDRNRDENYSPLTDVAVRDRIRQQAIYDHNGEPLRLPVVWVSNAALRADLLRRQRAITNRPPTPGYTFDDINRLTFNPDVVLTTVPGAKRITNQVTATVRTEQESFTGFFSASYTDLRGNVAGLTGFGTVGSDFSAGPGVRPNERINFEGRLPNIPAFDAKGYVTGPLPFGLTGGAFVAITLGEYFAPSFRITPRFRFFDENNAPLDDSVFVGVVGQTILIEERGTRKYPSNVNVDLRLEKRFTTRGFSAVVTGDLFNALGSEAIIQRNLTVNDGISTDPTSVFGAPRRRVTPMRLQLGLRLEH